MRRQLAVVLLLVSAGAVAGEVPKDIPLTPALAKKLGFRLMAFDTGDSSGQKGYRFQFPPTIKGCSAARAQAALVDLKGEQLSIVSADYFVKAAPPNPVLLFAYRPATTDMSIDVQYCCAKKAISDCRTAYSIHSVTKYSSQ